MKMNYFKLNLFVAFLFLISISLAQVPTYHQFYGNVVDVNGTLVERSVEIKACINGSVYGTLSENGSYGEDDLFFVENGEDGQIIGFYVDDYFSLNYTFKNEETSEINLVLSCSDFDGDGYGLGCAKGNDCDDSDAGKNLDCTSSLPPSMPGGGSSGGGGGGGGRTALKVCSENWTCENWQDCTNGFQARTCADKNNCNTTIKKPESVKSCVEKSASEIESSETSHKTSKSLELETYYLIILGVLIVLIIVTIVILTLLVRRSSGMKSGKGLQVIKLRNFVQSARERGYSSKEIRKMLKKNGWKEKDINSAMR